MRDKVAKIVVDLFVKKLQEEELEDSEIKKLKGKIVYLLNEVIDTYRQFCLCR